MKENNVYDKMAKSLEVVSEASNRFVDFRKIYNDELINDKIYGILRIYRCANKKRTSFACLKMEGDILFVHPSNQLLFDMNTLKQFLDSVHDPGDKIKFQLQKMENITEEMNPNLRDEPYNWNKIESLILNIPFN